MMGVLKSPMAEGAKHNSASSAGFCFRELWLFALCQAQKRGGDDDRNRYLQVSSRQVCPWQHGGWGRDTPGTGQGHSWHRVGTHLASGSSWHQSIPAGHFRAALCGCIGRFDVEPLPFESLAGLGGDINPELIPVPAVQWTSNQSQRTAEPSRTPKSKLMELAWDKETENKAEANFWVWGL